MDVDPPEPAPHQGVGIDEGQHFVVIHDRGLREMSQQPQNLAPAPECAAGEFAHHERMAEYDRLEQQPLEA